MMKFLRSLRQRFYFFLVLPMAIFLLGLGYLVWYSSQQLLLSAWQETATLKLAQAAQQIEMRLAKFRPWLQLVPRVGQSPAAPELASWILQQLREEEGVAAVRLLWPEPPRRRPQPARGTAVVSLSPLRFLNDRAQKTVTLAGDLLDQSGRPQGRIEIVLRWSYLLQDVFASDWFRGHQVSLIEENGAFLFHTDPLLATRQLLGETGNPLELALLQDLYKKPAGLIVGPGKPPELVLGYHRLAQTPWAVLLVAQGKQILAPIVRWQFYYATAGVLCLLVLLAFIRQVICPIILSIRELSQATMQVAAGHYGQPLPEERHDELGQLTRNFNAMVAGLKERDFIKNTFGRYVDPEIAKELLSRPEASLLGGDRRSVVILFADLRGFTTMAEDLSPEATIRLINRFFSRMIEAVRRHQGIIVDFFGDGLLAFFEPWREENLDQCVARGLQCAFDMQAAMPEINLTGLQLGYPPLHLGIGLHTGDVVVGNIGSESRSKYGIVGTAVNLTHRLQAKAQSGEIVLSAAAYRRLVPPPPIKASFQAALKGLKEPLTLYVIQAEPPPALAAEPNQPS